MDCFSNKLEDRLIVRRKLIFFGRVQGVGFRFELVQRAKRLGLVGWVRNRADGSVEAQIQGHEKKICSLLEKLRSLKRAHITRMEITELSPVKEEKGFGVVW